VVGLRRSLGGPVPEPGRERGGLVQVAQAEQGKDGKGAVAYPGIPVVPVALPAHLLGQASRGRRDDLAARGVGHQLERHRRPRHHLPPPAGVGRPAQPAAPELRGLRGKPVRLLRRHPVGRLARRFDYHAAGLALAQRPGPAQPVDVPLQADPDVARGGPGLADRVHGELRVAGGEQCPAVGQIQRVRIAAVAEPRLQVHREPHGAAYHLELAHQPVPAGRRAVGDRHEVVDLPDTVRGHEPGDQYRGVREVKLLADIVVPVRCHTEMAAAVGVQQGREDAGRVEPGTAEPVDRAVPADERCRLQIADQPVVADAGIAVHPFSRPLPASVTASTVRGCGPVLFAAVGQRQYRVQHRVQRVRAQDHDRRRRGPAAVRGRLPGLVLLRVPAAHQRPGVRAGLIRRR